MLFKKTVLYVQHTTGLVRTQQTIVYQRRTAHELSAKGHNTTFTSK